MLAVNGRGNTLHAFEHGDKIADVQIAHIPGDLGDTFSRPPELFLGQLYLLPVDVVHKGFPDLAVEKAGEVAGAQMAEIRHFLHGYIFSGVVPNKGDSWVYGAAGLYRELNSGCLWCLAHRGLQFLNIGFTAAILPLVFLLF